MLKSRLVCFFSFLFYAVLTIKPMPFLPAHEPAPHSGFAQPHFFSRLFWRIFYATLWQIAPPFLRWYLRKRARRAPDYLLHWDERFPKPGNAPPHPPKGVIWVHAVSVGETHAAASLIQALQQRYPNRPILLTQMTPTGRSAAQNRYANVHVAYLPYDKSAYMEEFLRTYEPSLGLMMETEIWPNLLALCQKKGIPTYLVNARLSEKSARAYQRIRPLATPALQSFAHIAAQTAADAVRYQALGASRISICGNTKYDQAPQENSVALTEKFKKRLAANHADRPVWIAASTRAKNGQDEETLLLEAWLPYQTEALCILVPRHPERFDAVAALATKLGYVVQRRSDNLPLNAKTTLWLGDSMGEMTSYYACADVAFIGGSLLPLGGQNLIEPASLGVPTIIGASSYNFAAATEAAVTYSACLQVETATQAIQALRQFWQNPDQQTHKKQAALAFYHAHQGATERIVALLPHPNELR
jgi:3-deoxy-D-manno-octulosonic-acid transferase